MRFQVVETVADDGGFHRTTTYDVVDGATGEVVLSFTGTFTDSMFADHKVYDGVRFVELDPSGEHVIVHGYLGPGERVPIPRVPLPAKRR